MSLSGEEIISGDLHIYSSSTKTFLRMINIAFRIHLGDRYILGRRTQKPSHISAVLKIQFRGGNVNVQ